MAAKKMNTDRTPNLKSIRPLHWVLCAGLAIGFLQTAHADTYRWVDDAGIVNFSEQKPRNVPESRITVISSGKRSSSQPSEAPSTSSTPSYTPSTSSSGGAGNLNADQQQMLAELKENQAKQEQLNAQIRRDNCERARRALDNLNSRGRIRIRTPDGREQIMPEEERQAKISSAQQGIAENCTG